ncbi:hypothetical protein diail_1879 [Diaporthe ilicicola]|nr:hypothetical protein diail_1879 [Diaporthe ilicicola]
MDVTTLLTFLLGLLHLSVGISRADAPDQDGILTTAFIYDHPYMVNSTDNKVIISLAGKGQCMSPVGFTETTAKGLASCELYCDTVPYNTWDCVAPTIDQNDLDWSIIFTDDDLYQWAPGTCSCYNSSDPTPSVGDDDSLATPAKDLAAAEATKQVRDLTTYGYQVRTYIPIYELVDTWTFRKIIWPVSTRLNLIGIFGVPIDQNQRNTLRVHEIWASNDYRDPSQRAFMHDDVLSFWRLNPLNRNLRDLKEIRFDTVIEPSLYNMRERIFLLMHADINLPLLITRNGDRQGEQEAFEIILTQTKFARRMQQATQDYEEFKDRSIEAFFFSHGLDGFQFGIYFDGYTNEMVGNPEIWSDDSQLTVRRSVGIAAL